MAPRVVLIADCRIVYSTILQYGGFVVLEARNGAEALEMVPKHMPDVVITELKLPVIDGREVLRRLKQHPLTRHIPVLIVTTDPRPEVRRQAMDEHCDRFVLKPCGPNSSKPCAACWTRRFRHPSGNTATGKSAEVAAQPVPSRKRVGLITYRMRDAPAGEARGAG